MLEAQDTMKFRGYVTVFRFICGFLCSFSFSLLTRQYTMNSAWRNDCELLQPHIRYNNLTEETNAKRLVLIAVMTHMGTVMTRAVGIHETWGREIPGKIVFFVGQSKNKTEVDLPLVILPVADDVYPPQSKAMLMLKYVFENYGERFQWFIRADDDVYFQSDNLVSLLTSIDSSDDILLGHPGTGKTPEKGRLGLDENSNFCIGGTGIIMSHMVLRKVYPHLNHCLKETVTAHEDSEVGRCLRKFVGVQCPWGYEANEFFHQEYGDGLKAYHGDLELISFEKVVSLHPVKDVRYQYRLHVRYLLLKERLNQNRAQKLRDYLKQTRKLLFVSESNPFYKGSTFHCHRDHCEQFHNKNTTHDENVLPRTWTSFYGTQSFSTQPSSSPFEFIQGAKEKGLKRIIARAQLAVKEEARTKLYHELYFGKYSTGYSREHPIYGNFYEIQYLVRVKRYIDGKLKTIRLPKRARIRESFGRLISRIEKTKLESELVNIVLPLSGSLKSFERFMRNMGEMLTKFHEKLRVFIVFFRKVTAPKPYKSLFDSYRKMFRDTQFVWIHVDGVFNSSVALQAAMKYFPKNNLLLFSQVDVIFDSDFLRRCRQNTGERKMYFPVSFRSYSNIIGQAKLVYKYNSGRWNLQDFSTFCAYSDVFMPFMAMHAGSVNLKEAPLVEQFLAREDHVCEIIRAPDPGLLCDVGEPRCVGGQGQSCKDSFGSTKELLDYMMKKKYLINYL